MIEVPHVFRQMPRWWRDGTTWLDALPGLVDSQCTTWGLQVDGPLFWGSNALVIPVTCGTDEFVLRMNPPGPEVDKHVAARPVRRCRGRRGRQPTPAAQPSHRKQALTHYQTAGAARGRAD
ncbi:hypothetical protein ACIA49_21080 [Kribbella sp. NPDC051587]|uniref:hypothetical protein n=1 Tax=Kribbella sp. NPDC051587 TaxID=3364119 RepID=UPI003787B5D9